MPSLPPKPNSSGTDPLAPVVEQALAGDRNALEQLVRQIQRPIYSLAVRFLFEPADAQDATQEILIRIVIRLSSFKGESRFLTWAYRVATNYLLNVRRGSYETLSFDEGYYYLNEGLRAPAYTGADAQLLEQEVKHICTTSMLICLSRPLRLAYILGEILDFEGEEGADILEITPATFRKRLSLARQKIRTFMARQCGLYDPSNPCRCSRQIQYNMEIGMITPGQLRFADATSVAAQTAEFDRFFDQVAVFRHQADYAQPEGLHQAIRAVLDSGQYPVLD